MLNARVENRTVSEVLDWLQAKGIDDCVDNFNGECSIN